MRLKKKKKIQCFLNNNHSLNFHRNYFMEYKKNVYHTTTLKHLVDSNLYYNSACFIHSFSYKVHSHTFLTGKWDILPPPLKSTGIFFYIDVISSNQTLCCIYNSFNTF